jgi:hypothetical protein
VITFRPFTIPWLDVFDPSGGPSGTADLDDDPVEANSVRPEVHLVIEGGSEENLEIEDSAFTGQKKFALGRRKK